MSRRTARTVEFELLSDGNILVTRHFGPEDGDERILDKVGSFLELARWISSRGGEHTGMEGGT